MNLEEEKRRIKRKKKLYGVKEKINTDNTKNYVNKLIVRCLLMIIIFFGLIIGINTNKRIEEFVKDEIFGSNMSFTKIGNVYNKYFGSVIPFEKLIKNEEPVFKENLSYESIDKYKDGFVLTVSDNYLVPIINSGVVVFIGEKDELGSTVIIQGSDEIDYWYSNITDVSVSLYDYVSKGIFLGTTKDNKLYLTFKKGSEYLDYDEVIK